MPAGGRPRPLARRPQLTVPLLDRLRADPEECVRRSVANHLKDIAHDHPATALHTAHRWIREGRPHTDAVVRHGLRGLIRKGSLEAFALIGARPDSPARITGLRPTGDPTPAGQPLTFTSDLHLEAQLFDGRLVQHYALTPFVESADGRRLHFLSQTTPRSPVDRTIRRSHPTTSLRVGTYRLAVLTNGTPQAHTTSAIGG
ncbi:hypothetical protein [Streptomyces sp. NPDC002205]|uniref:hypothetical protein n=1 Tax=Streptomyces sp. NPDC002205 TaxID=3154411 RepID=UPI0033242B7F